VRWSVETNNDKAMQAWRDRVFGDYRLHVGEVERRALGAAAPCTNCNQRKSRATFNRRGPSAGLNFTSPRIDEIGIEFMPARHLSYAS
jgi:hypothetical protein